MRKSYLLGGLVLGLIGLTELCKAQVTQTISYTGNSQSITLPASCNVQVTITCYGGQGASGMSSTVGATGGSGGLGAMASGVYTFTPNSVLHVYVGGAATGSTGGFNGGAQSGNNAGGGGGGTDVRVGGTNITDRIIVAGGGGGGGNAGCFTNTVTGGSGGSGGGGNGTNGGDAGVNAGGGSGAIGSAGGSAGLGCIANAGLNGQSFLGGSGGSGASAGFCDNFDNSGGGGGGGYVGGGGGGGGVAREINCATVKVSGAGGGAGGSNYFAPAFTNTTNTNGVRSGNGVVVITYFAINNASIAATSTLLCSGNSTTLTASGASTYTWVSPAGNSSSVVVTPSVTTTYTVNATTTITSGNCSSTAMITVSVNTTPTVNITSTPTLYCVGSTATLSASGATSYSWSTSAITQSITVSPAVTTSYVVTGTTNGCSNTKTISLTANSLPTVAVASASACTGQTKTLTATGASTYSWNTGATSSTLAVAAQTSSTVLNYTVTGTNTAGCSSSLVVNYTVSQTPTVGFTASSASVCSGNTLILTASGASTYTWLTGTTVVPNASTFIPVSSTSPSANVNYTATGATTAGCTNTAVATIAVVITPSQAPVASTTQVCAGNSVTLSTTAPGTHTWQPLNVNTNSVVDTPTATVVHTLTSFNGGCSSTLTIQVTYSALPSIFGFPNTASVCASQSISLTGGGANTYTWLPGTNPATGQIVISNPSVSTTYTLKASNGTCTNSITIFVFVHPNPSLSIVAAPSATICKGQAATLTAGSTTVAPAVNFTWSGQGTTPSDTTQSIVVTPTTTTSYTVTGADSIGCKSSTSKIIVVNALPVIGATTNSVLVCSGGQAMIAATNTSTAHTYSWSNGASTKSTTVFPDSTTIYTVTGTFTNTGCSKTATIEVSVFIPTMAIVGPSAACLGGQITLTASLTPLPPTPSYTWNGTYLFQNFSASPTVSTTYSVVGKTIYNNVECPASATVNISIFNDPTVTAVASPSAICRGELTSITGLGAATYSWSNGLTGTTVSVSPFSQTTYTVYGTDINGCMDTNIVTVKVSPCVGISEHRAGNNAIVIYPNPNSGNFNIVSDSEANLTLLNELGQVLKSIKLSSQGTYRVSCGDLPAGIYYLIGDGNAVPIRQKIVISE